jgi:two-component sensor histidine kinase
MTIGLIEGLGTALPRGLRVLRYGVPLMACVSALLWGIWTYTDERSAATQETLRNADLVRQYTERLIQNQTILHHAVRSRLDGETAQFLLSDTFRRYLRSIEMAQPFTEVVTVVGTGNSIASSQSYFVAPTDEQMAFLNTVQQDGRVFVDRSHLSTGEGDVMVVATPLVVGTFRGAIISAISVSTVREFLRKLSSEQGDAASLMREDGKLLVRNFPTAPFWLPAESIAMTAIRAENTGSYETVAVSDGVQRIYGFTRVGTLPLFAYFGSPSARVWSTWVSTVMPVWSLVAAIACLTFVMAGQIERGVVARFQSEADKRRLAEAERLAEQRRQLMNEMNHRVKNNLALVAALIGMQMRNQGTINGAELQARVMAISEVHELLHRSHDTSRIDFGDILMRLSSSQAIIPDERSIRVLRQIQNGVIVSPDAATALALIAAEVLTNAVKHAFTGRGPGTIRVTLKQTGPEAVMEISDDGVGLPAAPARSSGLRIIDGLVAQAGGKLDRTSDRGTSVRITFAVGGAVSETRRPSPPPPPEAIRAAS